MSMPTHHPGGQPCLGQLPSKSDCAACNGKGSMVLGALDPDWSRHDDAMPHFNLAIWGFFNRTGGLTGSEIMLQYYQRSHRPEYALSQTPDNLLFEPEPYADRKALIQAWYEQYQRFDGAFQAGQAEGEAALEREENPEHWDTKSLDRWFLRQMAWQYSYIYLDRSPSIYGFCVVQAVKRMTYLLDWFKSELSPENWEASILPDLLLIRAKQGYEAECEAEREHKHCDDYAVLVDGEKFYHPMMLKPFLLIDKDSPLIDQTGFPPGHPLPKKQIPSHQET